MKDRTIIIASHAVEALAPLAESSIFLEDGRAVWTGTGHDLLASKYMEHLKTGDSELTAWGKDGSAQADRDSSTQSIVGSHLQSKQIEALPKIGTERTDFAVREQITKTPRQLVMEENRKKGEINFDQWKDLKHFNGNNLFWSGMIALLFLATWSPVAERHVLE
jgi:ABC-type multidrug transport system ATPase subunit